MIISKPEFKNLETWLAFSLCVFWIGLSFSLAICSISLGFALGFYMLIQFKNRSWNFTLTSHRLMVSFTLYLVFVVISLVTSEVPAQSLRGLFNVLMFAFLFLVTAEAFKNPKYQNWLEIIFVIWLVFLIFDSIYQFTEGKDLIRHYKFIDSSAGVRLRACFKTYGHFASYLVLSIPLFFSIGLKYRNSKQMHKWYLHFSAFLFLLIALWYTRTRGAAVAIACSSFLMCFLYRKWKILLAAAAFAITVLCFMPRDMLIHLDEKRQEQSLVERKFLWDRAIKVIQAKPLSGTGINTYAVAHQKYDKTQNWRVRNYYAHNGYLQMAAEIGIPGLVAFLFFMLTYLRFLLKSIRLNGPSQKKLLGILAGILGFLVLMLVDTVFHNLPCVMTFWFLMGLGLAYHNSDTEALIRKDLS